LLNLIKKYPLLSCLIIAVILRLLATVYSKGFMAHDDHFETVRVAYDGIQKGLLNDEKLMIWNDDTPEIIGRSPLYVLFLFSMMKIQESVGIYSLDSMMYLIRFIHALLSLLIVYYGYKYVLYATESRNSALLAGLILSGHFLMPYLAVRNLIEMVSADLLMPSIFLAHRGAAEKNGRMLVMAGILAGLAWMIRFSTCLAVVPIPFIIWYLQKSVRPALYFCGGVFLMLLFSASLDVFYLGSFGRSTINILGSFIGGSPTLPQPFYMYLPLVFGILIPPFSIYFLILSFRREVISGHLVLASAILFFFISHSLIANKQERFLIPIFPLLIVLGVIGLNVWLKNGKWSARNRNIFKYSAAFAVGLNLILLPLFTFNYAHKGMVEPFVFLSEQGDVNSVLIDRTERRRFMALCYAGYDRPKDIILDNWAELDTLSADSALLNSINYFIIYTDNHPDYHADSLSRIFGSLGQVFHSTPSTVDYILHFLNPRHNHTNEAWVYRRMDQSDLLIEGD